MYVSLFVRLLYLTICICVCTRCWYGKEAEENTKWFAEVAYTIIWVIELRTKRSELSFSRKENRTHHCACLYLRSFFFLYNLTCLVVYFKLLDIVYTEGYHEKAVTLLMMIWRALLSSKDAHLFFVRLIFINLLSFLSFIIDK
jgi:hypothetical protein